MKRYLGAVCSMALLAMVPSAAISDEKPPMSVVTLDRLQNNSGITLQWIGWDERGEVAARTVGGTTFLSGGQIDKRGAGTLWLDGKVIEAGDDYFVFDGLIRIARTPDAGRECVQNKQWRFAITQNRKYYRLREFEWCDDLTDYIDIYF